MNNESADQIIQRIDAEVEKNMTKYNATWKEGATAGFFFGLTCGIIVGAFFAFIFITTAYESFKR